MYYVKCKVLTKKIKFCLRERIHLQAIHCQTGMAGAVEVLACSRCS